MLKRHSVLIGTTIAISLILIATMVYPGGSYSDKDSIGFDWTKNFISNLFEEKAVNGADNASRVWADAGMIFLCVSFSIFFIEFSKKIPLKGASKVIKYFGSVGMLFGFLIVTPLHNIMVLLSSTMYLVSIFYITVFVLKSKLHFLKFLCIICLLIFYCTMFLYGTSNLDLLPVMQKVTFASVIILILILEYFTKKEDFEHMVAAKRNRSTD